MMTQKALLDRLETELRELLETVRGQIAPLPAEALLFRPAPSKPKGKEAWNIMECLAHLNAYADDYLAPIDLAIHKAKARRWTAAPDEPVRYFGRGKRAIRRANPANGKWLKSPKRYNFNAQNLSVDPVKSFIINSERLLRSIQIAREVDLNKPFIRKAHAWTGRYSLGNLLEYLVTHQRRHVQQAQLIANKSGH
ncbi:MAG: DinB family protein [Saprospiraceae bacterium]|nr:DinB family protein [Saprospiraceae bacterium]